MDAGRPTKCTQEVLALTENYLKNFDTEYGDSVPTLCGLAAVINVHKKTIQEWKKSDKYPGFSVSVIKILEKQEQTLINNGLKGEFNSNITKLMLNNHGYHDRQEVSLSGRVTLDRKVKRLDGTLASEDSVDAI